MSGAGRGGADVDGVPGCSRVHQGPSAPSPRPEQGVGRSQRTPGGYLAGTQVTATETGFMVCTTHSPHSQSLSLLSSLSLSHQKKETRDK